MNSRRKYRNIMEWGSAVTYMKKDVQARGITHPRNYYHINGNNGFEDKEENIRTRRMSTRRFQPVKYLFETAFIFILVFQEIRAYPHQWYDFPDTMSIGSLTSVEIKTSEPSNFVYKIPAFSRMSSAQNIYTEHAKDIQPLDSEQKLFTKNAQQTNIDRIKEQKDGSNKEVMSLEAIENLIQKAIQDGDLLSPQQWDEHRNTADRKRNVQRDTSRLQSTYTTEESHQMINTFHIENGYPKEENRHTSLVSGEIQADGKIVFPDERAEKNRQSNRVEQRSVPACKDSTFCETPTFYPENIVNDAVRKDDKYKYLASVDVITGVEQRIDVTDDVPLCVSTEQIVYPKTAENRHKEWHYIVNQDNFTQGVRIETCTNEDTPCRMYDHIPAGYKSSCKQKYIYRQLAAVVDGTVTPDMFRFPSSCCCHVKFLGNPLARISREQTTVRNSASKK